MLRHSQRPPRRLSIWRILAATALTVATLPLVGASVASAATVGGFEIDGDMVGGGGLDWGSAEVQPQPASTDGVGANETYAFVPGNSAKELAPQNWQLNNSAVAPAANDVGDLYTHSTTDAGGDQFIFFGFEREKNTGSVSYGIELNQEPNVVNAHGVSIPDRTAGDVMISATQQGGAVFSIGGVYTWSGAGWVLVPGGIGAIVGDTNDSPIADVDGNTLAAGRFLEVSVNLTDVFNVPSCPGKNFAALNARSRTSQSISSDGKDYVAPVSIDIADTCGELTVEKYDEDGTLLPGATFSIAPNPIPLTLDAPALVVTDGGANDPDGLANGVIFFEEAKPTAYDIVETQAPAGYIRGTDYQRLDQELALAGELTVAFTNQLGSVSWTKVDAVSGEKICCAEFLLEATGGDAAGLFTPVTVVDNGGYDADPDAGEILVDDLYTGDYSVTETKAPTGYQLGDPPQSFGFTVTAANQDAAWATPIENERKRSRLAVLKLDDLTGDRLRGGGFTLWNTNGTPVNLADDTEAGSCTTGADGTCEVGNLDFGTYYWEETAAPIGYELPANVYSVPIMVDATNAGGLVATTTFEDPQIPSELTVTKVDRVDGSALKGAEFALWLDDGDGAPDAGDTQIDTCTSGASGQCTVGGLSFGSYYWEETAAPTGYTLPGDVYSDLVTVDAANAGSVLPVTTFEDPRELSSLRVTKVDEVDHSSLQGAEFTLWLDDGDGLPDAGDTVAGSCTTAGDGTCTVGDLGFGSYYWEETTAPTGYTLPGDVYSDLVTVTAANAGGVVSTSTFEDPRKVSSLRVKKVDEVDGSVLTDAVFTLWNTNGTPADLADDTEVGSCVTAAAGTCTVGGLDFGTYYWEETAAPTGYTLPGDVYSDLITVSAANAGGVVSTSTFEDPRVRSALTVRKVDDGDSSTLPGAGFTLWLDDGDGMPDADDGEIGACTTGAEGQCVIGDLDFGTYYWEETSAPTGYDLPADVYSGLTAINASNAGAALGITTFADPRKLSELAVRKLDATDDSLLAGAVFELWLDSDGVAGPSAGDTSMGTCETDASGGCEIDGLDFGTYYWEETDAPTGYELPAIVYSSPIAVDTANAGTALPVTSFEDNRLQSDLSVEKLDEEDGAYLDGADFTLWLDDGDDVPDAGDTEIGTCTTGDGFPTGTCSLADLDFGTYYWQETGAPTGYELPGDVYSDLIVVDAASAGTTLPVATFEDPRRLSELSVQKVDAQDESPLAGAVFELWLDSDGVEGPSAGDTSMGTCETDAAGVCEVDELDFGTYYWEETAAPTGYELPGDVYSDPVVVEASNAGREPQETTFADPRKLSELAVQKIDSRDERPLAGALFTLYDVSGTPEDNSDDVQIGNCTSGDDGTCGIDELDFGTYYWVETSPPTGYEPAAPGMSELITIDADTAGTVLAVTVFANDQTPSSLGVEKVDEEDGSLLAGATFALYEDTDGSGDPSEGDGAPVATCTTDSTGGCEVDGLLFGDYYWEEIAAPTGYELPAVVFSEVITIDAGNAGTTLPVTSFADPRTLSHIEALKVDAETGEPLSGAVFQLWLDDGDGALDPAEDSPVGDPQTTADDGTTVFGQLSFGDYVVEEIEAPEGYYLPVPHPTKLVSVTVDNAGGRFQVTFEDPKLGSLLIRKAQFQGDQPLENGGQAGYADLLTYQITVTSTGPGTEHNVVVTDHVPGYAPEDTTSTAQAIYIAGSQTCIGEGKCQLKYKADTRKLTWRVGHLAAGESRTVEFEVRIPLPVGVLNQIPGEYHDMIWNVAAVTSVEHEPQTSNPVRAVADTAVQQTEPPTDPPLTEPPSGPPPNEPPGGPPPNEPPGAPPKETLPDTGAPAGLQTLLGIGALALLTGASLLIMMRRRDSER